MKFGPILGHFSPFLKYLVDLHEILYSRVFLGADFKNFINFAKFTPEMAFLGPNLGQIWSVSSIFSRLGWNFAVRANFYRWFQNCYQILKIFTRSAPFGPILGQIWSIFNYFYVKIRNNFLLRHFHGNLVRVLFGYFFYADFKCI